MGGVERGKEEEGEEWRGKRGEERSMRLKKIMLLPAHRHINSMLTFFQAQIHTHTHTYMYTVHTVNRGGAHRVVQ